MKSSQICFDKAFEEITEKLHRLELENEDLKKYLRESQSQYGRMEARDELILQYECEINVAKTKLNKSNQVILEMQALQKLVMQCSSELAKATKLNEKSLKTKATEIVGKLSKAVGTKEEREKLETLMYENNLTSLMADNL
eukprot:CAMPEP_0202978692 /NCGR_PEP_ID=MMETSP1396-20130829/85038_1 /ASSEMBLY_ACC=CAM_ASM_000872 /TAXON_ID= /ORGANISM="Pseudokeronopsis sp., Strain Brazil" /LENGTH=140 /DNA_ID=CAMNT_0049717765 /DNA_START=136 /DNA_END=558 /DNA_ORIENTATION=-